MIPIVLDSNIIILIVLDNNTWNNIALYIIFYLLGTLDTI